MKRIAVSRADMERAGAALERNVVKVYSDLARNKSQRVDSIWHLPGVGKVTSLNDYNFEVEVKSLGRVHLTVIPWLKERGVRILAA